MKKTNNIVIEKNKPDLVPFVKLLMKFIDEGIIKIEKEETEAAT